MSWSNDDNEFIGGDPPADQGRIVHRALDKSKFCYPLTDRGRDTGGISDGQTEIDARVRTPERDEVPG